MYPPPTEIYTLSLHDALPILNPLTETGLSCSSRSTEFMSGWSFRRCAMRKFKHEQARIQMPRWSCCGKRSEEHTSELQSPVQLVCRLLLEKQNLHAAVALHPT